MGITWLRGNALTLLENGTEFFPALETAIDGATTEIFLETYIFAHDDTGHRIAAALPGRRPGVCGCWWTASAAATSSSTCWRP
jgi:hypothetical protein